MKRTNNKYLCKLVKQIIINNIYMSLATCGKKPWVAPVYYCVDKKLNFYFISRPKSKHIKHLVNNDNAAFAIFDSHQKEGTGNGVQGMGKVEVLADEDIFEALKWYKTTYVKLSIETFGKPNPYRIYKMIPTKFYVLDPKSKADKRVEVSF